MKTLVEKWLDESPAYARTAARHLAELDEWRENRRKEVEEARKYWAAKGDV